MQYRLQASRCCPESVWPSGVSSLKRTVSGLYACALHPSGGVMAAGAVMQWKVRINRAV